MVFSMAPGETSHPEEDPSASNVQQNQNDYFLSIKMNKFEIGFTMEKY